MFKADNKSVCSTCSQKVGETQGLKCSECECFFHAVCPSAPNNESKICTSTFLTNYVRPTTKPNFTWTCDECLTEAESVKVATLSQLIKALTKSLNDQLSALTEQVSSLTERVNTMSEKNAQSTGTVWDERQNAQANKMKSALVIKPDGEGNKVNSKEVRKIVHREGIPVDSVVELDNGETFVNLPDTESRDRVGQLLEESHTDNPVVKLKSKLPSIEVMGVTAKDIQNEDNEDLSPEELDEVIYKQNKEIAQLIDAGSELKVVYIRKPPARRVPTRKAFSYYTVAIRVSPNIRDLIKKMKDKIHMGLTHHNIRDRFYVRRCNKCQGLGHYEDKCDESNHLVCGFCTKEHKSDDCPEKKKDHKFHNCINCSGEGLDCRGHPAFWKDCPAYKLAQKRMSKTIAYDYSYLNW